MKKIIPLLLFLFCHFLPTFWAQNPTPYSPARSSISNQNNFILKWNHGSLPFLYDVEVDTFMHFPAPMLFTNIAADSLIFTTNSTKTHYWRVRHAGQNNNSSTYWFRYFDPVLAGGLQGWFSALNISQANNSSLQNWNSLAVTALASNANAATSPTYLSSGGPGNKPMVKFSGGLKQLTTNITGAQIAHTDPISFYFLGKLLPQAQPYGFIFTMANFALYTPLQQNRAAYNHNANATFLWASNGSTGQPQYFITSSGNANTWRFFTAIDNTVQAKVFRNSIPVGSSASAVYSINPAAPIILGSNVNYNNNASLATSQMEVAEMLFFNADHNDSTRILLEKYLIQRYLPPVNLGKDTSINPLCGSILLRAGDGFSSYLWSTGSTSANLTVNAPGTYWVSVQDGYGHSYTDTINIGSQSSFNQPPASVYFCQNDSFIWQTNLPDAQYDFLWSTGSTDSSLTITSPGAYFVQITETSTSCTFTSDTVQFIMDPFPNAGLGNDTTLCINNDLFLNMPTQPGSTFLWSTGDTSEQINLSSGGTYWVHATNENGCTARDTIQVNISGTAPDIDFSMQNRCENVSSQFSYTSNMNPISFLWNFGDGNNSTQVNPTHSYLNPGNYPVSLFLLADNGCGNLITKNVAINPKPILQFHYSDTCVNDSVVFIGQATPLAGGIASVLWDFNDPASGINNQSDSLYSKHVYALPGNYFVTLNISNDSGCTAQLTQPVSIKDGAYPDFDYSGHCFQAPTLFTNNSQFAPGVSPLSYTWYMGNGSSSGLFSPQITYNLPDTYAVTLRVTTNNQCKAYKTILVPVMHGVEADFDMPDSICSGVKIPFQNLSYGINDSISEHIWRMGSTAQLSGPAPDFAFQQAGNRIVRLINKTAAGCRDSVQYSIEVLPKPQADFSISNSYGTAPLEVSFTYSGQGAQQYYWDFGNGENSSLMQPNPVIYDSDGIYEVQLQVWNQYACSDSGSLSIQVGPRLMDAEWYSLQCIEQNNLISYSGYLINTGSEALEELEFGAHIDYDKGFREKWSGNLASGQGMTYTYTGQSPVLQGDLKKFCCVEVYFTDAENQLQKRSKCAPISSENWIGYPYPNPANSFIKIDAILSEDKNLPIRISDLSGKIVYTSEHAGQKGLQEIQIPVHNLARGMYILQIDGQVHKFIVDK